jgi:hypothetical protein
MKKAFLFFCALLLIAFAFKKTLTHNIACAYQKIYAIMHYEYASFFDQKCYKELSYHQKLFCDETYATEDFLHKIKNFESAENIKALVNGPKRKVEVLESNGKQFVVKTKKFNGFFSNIFRMGMGVNIWNNAKKAKSMGISVLEPIALTENRTLFSTTTRIFYLHQGVECEKQLDHAREWFDCISEARKKLEKSLCIHDDFRLKNMVVLEDKSILLIDIDKIHWYPNHSYVFHVRTKREVRKFNQNLRKNYQTELELQ